MKKGLMLIIAALIGLNALMAGPVDEGKAKAVGRNFVCARFDLTTETADLQLVYTGLSNRNEACFYVYNVGEEGFVIVSADDRFRPIVGYSDEGPFATENMSPELRFYLDKIIEARTNRNAVLFDDTAEEWQSVMTTGKLLSRNGGRGVDYICTTKWNQDSPYNLYAPEATGGPGGRCYAGCVATAMSQVMKRWDHPLQGTGSHTYNSGGWWGPYYPNLSANFGATTYDWEHMPERIAANSPQEEIEAVATLMYHCAVAVDMNFAPDGSGANSEDVPEAIQRYFSYSDEATLRYRDMYSLSQWQNMLKESFDLGWPVYYSGHSDAGGHAFVCDGYDDEDLFHFNWGWGGSSDGWFVVDEIDFADWAAAVFNFVPSDVYDYMPMQPDNLKVETLGDSDYSAIVTWNNPTHNIHGNALASIDQIVVVRDGKVVYTEDNVTPGAAMSFTDHYMPTMVTYTVYAVVHNAKGLESVESDVLLGPTCTWRMEMTTSNTQGWNEGYLYLKNSAGVEIRRMMPTSSATNLNFEMPVGHVGLCWKHSSQSVEEIGFELKDQNGQSVISFKGSSADIKDGMFFVVNNTCDNNLNHDAPANIVANVEGNDVVLHWDAAEGAVNYYGIYRDRLLYALSETTSFTDSNASDMFHNYYVTAITDLGESDPSNICNIQPETTCAIPTGLRYELTGTKVKISWNAPQEAAPTGYFVYRRTRGEEFKRIKSIAALTYTDNVGSKDDEFYEYAVSAFYAEEDCTSAYATTAANPELYFVTYNRTDIPSNLNFLFSEGILILDWDDAARADSYNVYRDDELIASGLTYSTFADYDAVSQHPYRYTVTGNTAFYESSPSNEVYVDWTTGMAENTNQSIAVYPNPTEDRITIEGEGIRQVRVFNMMGQEIENQIVDKTSFSIDLSAQPTGCYFIEVVTEQGCEINKVLKIK